MKKFIAICLFLIIGVVSYVFFNTKLFSNDDIEQRVLAQQDYKLALVDRKVPIEIFVKPEWIPQVIDEELVIQEVVATIEGNEVLLDNVIYRDNDIYFSFTTKNKLHRNRGILIANQIIEPDGRISSGSFTDELKLYTTKGEPITIGQIGIGPKFDFSFGIDLTDASNIQQGFYVKNTSIMLYSYKKK